MSFFLCFCGFVGSGLCTFIYLYNRLDLSGVSIQDEWVRGGRVDN